jgi:hypothetical protein
MHRNGALALAGALAVAGAGCSSVTLAYERRTAVEEGTFQFDDASVEESFAKRAQIRFPARVAVFGIERNRFGRWADPEVVQFEAALGEDGEHVAEVLPLPGFLTGEGRVRDVAALRRTAARAHADAILLYEQDVALEDGANALRILNLTIVGAWVIPSTWYRVDLETTAALVDVRNGVVYATLHDARSVEESCPSARVAEAARETKKRVRGEAFDALVGSLREKLRRMRETASAEGNPVR